MKNIPANSECEWQQSFDWERTEDITAEEVSAKEGWSYLTKEQAKETAHFIRTMGMLIFRIMAKQKNEEQQEAEIIPLYTNEQLKKAA